MEKLHCATRLCKAIKTYFIPPVRTDFDPRSNTRILLARGRERILTALLRFASLLAIFGIASITENLISKHRWDLLVFYLSITVMVWLFSFYRKIPYEVRCFFFLSMVYLLAVVDLSFFGIGQAWQLFSFGFAVLMTIFLGWKAGIAAVFICELTFVMISWQISGGNIVISASIMESPVPTKMDILTFSLFFLMITGVVVSAVATAMRELESAWQQERHAVNLVQSERDHLELSVAERTSELQNKNARLEAAMEDIKTLKKLLPICSTCKKIRDGNNWEDVDVYMRKQAKISFSHSMCPDCTMKLYPDLWKQICEEKSKSTMG